MNSRQNRNDDYRESTRHGTTRVGTRDTRDTTDDRRRKEPKVQNRTTREEPVDVDMDDDSDGYERHGGRRDTYSTSGPTGRTQTVTAGNPSRRRHDDLPDEPERTIIPLNPERDQPRVRPGSDRDFWIPYEGIEREVITYEITRYLGQDALVRPGKDDKGRSGYLITAFRAPTTEMIRSMKEASDKYLRERNSRSRPAAYSSSRTANDRDQENIRDRDRDQDQPRRRGRDYDSDDSMDDAPPAGRGYDRYDDRRDPEPRRDRHGREREMDSRQVPDARYQDPRLQDPRLQDPRVQDSRPQDPRYQDPRLQDPRLQDPRIQDPRYQDPRYQDPRDLPVISGRHQAYTSSYADPAVPAYALSPTSQAPGFDYSSAQPRTMFSGNTPPPPGRGGQSMYPQPGYPPVSQGAQMMVDPRTGRQVMVQVPVPGGAYAEPRNRHERR